MMGQICPVAALQRPRPAIKPAGAGLIPVERRAEVKTSFILVTLRHLRIDGRAHFSHDRGENQRCDCQERECCLVQVIVHTHRYSNANATPRCGRFQGETPLKSRFLPLKPANRWTLFGKQCPALGQKSPLKIKFDAAGIWRYAITVMNSFNLRLLLNALLLRCAAVEV